MLMMLAAAWAGLKGRAADAHDAGCRCGRGSKAWLLMLMMLAAGVGRVERQGC